MAEKKYTRIDAKPSKGSSNKGGYNRGGGKSPDKPNTSGSNKSTGKSFGKKSLGKSSDKPAGKVFSKPGKPASTGKGNGKRGKSENQQESINQMLAERLQKALDGDFFDNRSKGKPGKGKAAGAKRIMGTRQQDDYVGKTTKKDRGFAAMAEGKAGKPRHAKDQAVADKKDGGKATKTSKRLPSHARVEDAIAAKPRKNSPCPVDNICGGCTNITVPYEKQLSRKTIWVKELLWEANLPLKGLEIRPILGMEDPYHYRNKVSSPFARGKKMKDATSKTSTKDKGRRRKFEYEVLTGMYRAGTHQLVNTNGCLIENQQANRVIKVIKDLMIHHGIEPYDEDSGEGFLRHAVVRVGHNSGEVLVTLVTNQREFPSSKAFCRELISRCPYVTTVVQNINTRQTNVILGQEEQVLYGPGFILDTLCDLSFRISSQSFYQVNAVQTEVLYRTAIGLAGLTGKETVIDAYCGTGTIGLVAAKNGAANVIGVDSVADAIRDARTNAHHNGIENSLFMVGDAGQVMSEWAAEGKLDPDNTVLMMDPPRAGSSVEFLNAACKLGPARIVYISCNPETQMRDLRILVDNGYQMKVLQPVDMFPQTDHVETIVLLSKAE